MSLTREQMLAEMGIAPIWRLREAETVAPAAEAVETTPRPPEVVAPAAVAAPSASVAVDALEWPELAARVAACQACPLCEQRKQAVLGVGDLHPDWLFVGEGPGAEEDVKGEPFVGQAGKLLDNMLAALDLARGNRVYIGNAVKCRPPGNRTPEAAEMAACRPWLERQIALLRPKIIVLLGKAAVHALLHEDKSLASLRGRRFEYQGIPVVVTYHPAYLLRNLPEKAKAWEDLLFARRCLREATAAGSRLPF
ncbi:uracil-DNA glycosylase family protein [Dechloromonas sp. H13]|uniref:uracil-DNA glycosylase n=1 Tax=Dechloromonas sp. H13 TaxID=2570193 RepID=UPI0012911EEB|nr:uracil-DNA glycosylase [Dechloromonas sp. H13]